MAAIAQNSVGVTALKDLIETVRYIDDANPFALQNPYDPENVLNVLFLKHRCQFIQDEYLGFVEQRLGQLDNLSFSSP